MPLVAVLQGRVTEISCYEAEVRSVNQTFNVPSVVALKSYHKRRRISFTRYHVFLRDSFSCQYCCRRMETTQLTFDHVVPKSRGGTTCWENIVDLLRASQPAEGQQKPAGIRPAP